METSDVLKQKWIAALRSGKYKQGKGVLRGLDNQGENSYCCLGVLCDIVDPTKWVNEADLYPEEEVIIPGKTYFYVTEDGDEYSEWPPALASIPLGLDRKVKVQFNGEDHVVVIEAHLADLNDRGASFEEIADWIEETV